MSAASGKRVLVTGVTSGIGKATVAALLEAGASVLGLGRSEARLSELSAGWGPRFTPVVADLAKAEARQAAIVAVAGAGALDAIINNAAECIYQAPLATPIEQWSRLLEINLLAPLQLIQGLHHLLVRNGQIINLSSVNARGAQNPKFAPYGVSKGALAQVTDALRVELAPKGIRVCQVTPGLVETELYQKVNGFERVAEKLHQAIPQWLRAEDVAQAIVRIVSQPAHVTVGDLVLLPTGQGS